MNIEELLEQYRDNDYYNLSKIENITKLCEEIERLNSIIKEVREKVNNFDVFKEFTFPLMKRDVENQVKSSVDYEWIKSIKEPILEILDKVDKDV